MVLADSFLGVLVPMLDGPTLNIRHKADVRHSTVREGLSFPTGNAPYVLIVNSFISDLIRF